MASGDDTLPASESDLGLPMQFGRYQVIGQLGAGGAGIVLAALDPTLHRKVALKVLRPRAGSTDGDARLAAEAQAMARLAHPNVVTVFEIDRVGDQVFVAMELVEGATLRGWMQQPHGWREVLETFIAAGRGLAAAHAAGLVHRDFKPDNVMIGTDGRPRVTDFGLVLLGGERRNPDSEELIADVNFHGSIVGTPAYMSSEQWEGGAVDARSDQFAFCVSLWEALFGARPFAGERVADLRAALRTGQPGEPGDRRVPRWLVAALKRGLLADPGARWPDMPALLDRLSRGLHRRRSTAVASAAVAIAAAAVVFAVVEARRVTAPCAPPSERVARLWSPGIGELLRLKLALVDPVQGASRFDRIAGALDAGARDWSAMHVEACRATRVEGRQSDTLLDQRMACLDRWLDELGQTAHAVGLVTDPAAVDQAVHAVQGLSPLAVCADTRALAQAPPPASAADRATAARLATQIAEVEVAQRTGRYDGLPAKARDIVAAAKVLGHDPTLSAALAAQARALWAVGEDSATGPVLRELVVVAARAHADRDEAFAWMHLMLELSDAEGKPEEALGLASSANAAVLRAGDTPDLRADLLYMHATVLDSGPHPEQGRELLKQARALLDKSGTKYAGRLGDILMETGTSYVRSGDNDAGVAAYHEAIERWRAAYGNDSTDEAYGWHNLGASLVRVGKLDDARAAYTQAVRIRESRLGETVLTAGSLVGLASVFDEERRYEASLALYDRALAIQRAKLPAGDLRLANALIGGANALKQLKRYPEAGQRYDETVGLFENAGGKTINFAIALANRASFAELQGRCADAIHDDARALTLLETLASPTSRWLIFPLVGQAACLLKTGKPHEAIPLLERALKAQADENLRFDLMRAKGLLGRAWVETGRDRAAGLAMVRETRDGLPKDAQFADEIRELDRWLAAHR